MYRKLKSGVILVLIVLCLSGCDRWNEAMERGRESTRIQKAKEKAEEKAEQDRLDAINAEIRKENEIRNNDPEYKAELLMKSIKESCGYYELGGYFNEVNWKIEESLNNPDSFEHVKTRMVEKPEEECIYAEVTFRGTNSFNAIVTQTMYFKLYQGCRITVED